MVRWDGFSENVGEVCALKRQDLRELAQDTLEKVYRYVKPIMRKRNYRVHKLVEFLPRNANLLGLNVNKGQRISLRLRYAHDPKQFLPFDHVLGTMLHELCHNTFGPHDKKFFALLEELKGEMDDLLAKGFTGDPFMGQGNKLNRQPSPLTLPNLRRRTPPLDQTGKVSKGRKLGGLGVRSIRRGTPKEMAFQAAENRRLADLMCKTADRVEDLESDEQGEIIDLTSDDGNQDEKPTLNAAAPRKEPGEETAVAKRTDPEIIVILDD